MISVLTNQRVSRRASPGVARAAYAKKSAVILSQSPVKASGSVSLKRMIKYPLIITLAGIVVAVFINAPNIFAATLKNEKPVDLKPVEQQEPASDQSAVGSYFNGYSEDGEGRSAQDGETRASWRTGRPSSPPFTR